MNISSAYKALFIARLHVFVSSLIDRTAQALAVHRGRRKHIVLEARFYDQTALLILKKLLLGRISTRDEALGQIFTADGVQF